MKTLNIGNFTSVKLAFVQPENMYAAYPVPFQRVNIGNVADSRLGLFANIYVFVLLHNSKQFTFAVVKVFPLQRPVLFSVIYSVLSNKKLFNGSSKRCLMDLF